MNEKTLAQQVADIIDTISQLSDEQIEVLNSVVIELKQQEAIIEYLYDALGPASDDIMDMAVREASKIK